MAREAAARGDQPYGAVLVDAGGSVLAEAGNTIVTMTDCTAHAELNLVRRLGGLPALVLAGATLHASTEPCAIRWCGLLERDRPGRVRAIERAALWRGVARLAQGAAAVQPRGVSGWGAPVTVAGPLLEDEAAEVVAEWAAGRAGG